MFPMQVDDGEVGKRGVLSWVSSCSPKALVADGLDRAILGVLKRPDGPDLVVYSCDRVVASLVEDGMTLDEAEEYASFNIYGAYVGPGTPLFVRVESEWPDASPSS
jgi:hypothetical protein